MLIQREEPVAVAVRVTQPGAMPKPPKSPHAAVGADGTAYVAFGSGDDIYVAASPDGGRRFAPPVRVGSAGKLALGMRRGPRVAVAGRSVVVSTICGRQGGGRDGDVVAWRSADGGKSWQGPVTVSGVPGAAREGLHAMEPGPGGEVACAWLDLREKGTTLFCAVSKDGGKTWGQNRVVYRSPDGTICECCHPSLAFDGRGRLYAMWRNWLGGARDMYLARSEDGGRTFGGAQKLGEGTWPLNACPMDGGMLAAGAGGAAVTTVWRRRREMFACAPGGRERGLGPGEQGWVAADASGTAHAVWIVGRPGRLLAAVLPRGGGAAGVVPTRTLSEWANDPVVACAPTGRGPVVAAWTAGEGDAPYIEAAVLAGNGRRASA